jgi:MAF protein
LLGLPSRVAAADLDEKALLLSDPPLAAINVALAKARATPCAADEAIVAADTLVVFESEILGKPSSPSDATAMLERLRGRDHQVMTGVVVRRDTREWAAVVSTAVRMRTYTADETSAYVSTGEPFDKAGGYAIQDQAFRPVERVDGCYLNVVGLPLCAAAAGLNALGVQVQSARAAPCDYCERGGSIVRSG